MLVNQAFKFELDPSNVTRSKLSSHCGASRRSYNWGLALVRTHSADRQKVRQACYAELLTDEQTDEILKSYPVPWTLPALRKEWNRQKHEVAPWWAENSKEAYSSGFDALERALKGYFNTRSGQWGGERGFPRFKKRSASKSCRFTTGVIKIKDTHHIQLPRIGVIRTKEETTALLTRLSTGDARILSATISETAGRWFVSYGCEVSRKDLPAKHPLEVVGVDLGVKTLATLSTGAVIESPKPLNRYTRKMSRLQREMSRRHRGSGRHKRTCRKVARVHQQVANARKDATHKLTTALTSTYGTVVIEDLNVVGMTAKPKPVQRPDGSYAQNGRRRKAGLNRAIADASFGEIRRQIEYKAKWRGGQVIVVDRFYPSSKTCSSCGAAKAKLSLAERTYSCDACGLVIDRDLNAALNLAAYGRQVVAGSGPETGNARGGEHPRRRLTKSPVKREDGTGQPGKTATALSQGRAA